MSKLERRITIAAVVLPFLGFLVAIVLLWGGMVSALDLGIMAVMYLISGFGITVGYHRMLTHRSFETSPAVRGAFAIAGSMSLQGAPIHWVADHRKHHDFSDEQGDPHSPHTHNHSGWRGVIVGWWHSHTGWLFDRKDRASATRYARDLREDPLIQWVDRHFITWVLLGLAIPFVLGFALSGGVLAAGLTAMLWGGFVRIFLQHHATWSVNSICHMYGDDPFETGDKSRNNAFVALVALGEGWHHNHHAFPTSARHGLRRTQIDPSYGFILLLQKLGLVWNVRSPKPAEIQRKLKGAGEGVSAPAPAADAAAPVADTPEGDAPSEDTRSREPVAV
ncbi:MAG: acyl-CoA desaturase [Thermoleophilaceae bacterium]|nr:acyl-CoA desaturase [Thermoleophilaceae bacterium]